MARIAQVKDFNALVDVFKIDKAYCFTVGTGSMQEKLRVKGWVVFEHPKLGEGDTQDFAKWFPNKELALVDWGSRC